MTEFGKHLDKCGKCGEKFLTDGTTEWCPDCIEEFLPEPEEPDVVDLMESKFHARRRERNAARALDNFDDRE